MNFGIVVKKTANSFDVYINNNIVNCFARGILKKDSKIIVGDFVELELVDGKNVIKTVLPRKNMLIRPYVANIEQLIIVVSTSPKPDLLILDKLIIGCIINDITPIIVINKADINGANFYNELLLQYKNSVDIIIQTSAKTGFGIQELKNHLIGKVSTFTGQSGVGKSSLINQIFDNLNLKTNIISERINMGKNTTRHSEIYILDNNTLIADTPGFNMLDFENINPTDLKDYYPEFDDFSQKCYFKNCTHVNVNIEKCGVVGGVESGDINKLRYLRYVELYKKLEDIWRRKYD